MVAPQTVFPGDEDETRALVLAVSNNCACVYELGVRKSTCSAHQMLVSDQRALNGLVWIRRCVARIRAEEFGRKKKT